MNQKNTAQTFGIIGLGRFGMSLAKQLCEADKEVIVLDCEEDKIKEIREFTEQAYVCENLTKQVMQEAGIGECDTVVVCIGERLDVSILTALNVLGTGVSRVMAKATSPEHGMILEKMGVHPLFPEQEAASWTARSMISHKFLDYFPLSENIEIAKIQVGNKLLGKSVSGVGFRQFFGLNIIAVEHKNIVSTEVDAEYIFESGDIVIVIGKNNKIRYFEDFMG